MLIHTFVTILALSTAVHGLAFDGPLPTPIAEVLKNNINGWTPKPTHHPRSFLDVLRRDAADDKLCGYVEGLSDYPLTCASGPCRHNTALNWFGCCASGDDSSCNIATRCIPSSSVDACLADPSCGADQHVKSCADPSAPFCVQVNTVVSQATLSHFVCAATSTVVTVKAQATGDGSDTGGSSSGDGAKGNGSTRVSEAGAESTKGELGGGDANATATTASVTAGVAMQTARAIVGVVGGVVGLIPMFF